MAGGALGIISGILITQGFGFVTKSTYYENTSGFPEGWSFYVSVLIFTVSGSLSAVIGYTLRQRLVHQRCVKNNAIWYALAGAVSWPIIGVLFVFVVLFIIGPLSRSVFSNVHWAASDIVVWLDMVLSSIVLALPVGLAVAIYRRKEADW
jgi:hypothetical protein